MNENLTWEERYEHLEAHHEAETKWLIEEVFRLEQRLLLRNIDLDKVDK